MNHAVTSSTTSISGAYNTFFPVESNRFQEEYNDVFTLVEQISKTPRFYQANAVNKVADYLEQGLKRIGVVSPTGTGKTLIAKLVSLSKRVRTALGLEENQVMRILYVSNKHRLNRQAAQEFKGSTSCELIFQSAMSGIPDDVMLSGFDLVILDECHHEAMNSIQKNLTKLTKAPIIGLTAEEKRGDGLLLKFERFIYAITEFEAARRGFTEKVGINTIIDMAGSDKSDLTKKVISQFSKSMGNTIIFLRTEKEVRAVYRYIRYVLKLRAIMFSGKTTEAEMDSALDQLSEGKVQFIVNCQKIGEGVDGKNITDVVLARPFGSAAEKKQYIGRAIRPDSPCAVWEFVNPLIDSIVAKSVVGLTKYERLISVRYQEWDVRMISGEDLTWGKMSDLRVGAQYTEIDYESDNENDFNDMGDEDSLSEEKKSEKEFNSIAA